MMNVKRVVSLLLVVFMAAVLFGGCGGAGSNQDASDSSKTGAASTVAENTGTGAATEAGTVEKSGTADSKLPDVQLENKKITVYNIDDNMDGWRSQTQYPGAVELLEKEYGAQFEVVGFADWGKQYEKLTTLYMSDNMPDLLLYANFPTDLANNFVQPLDNLIDFSDPMWDDVRQSMDMIKWKGKNYFAVSWPLSIDWLFFNPQIFEANNLKTPLEYWKEGNWDWNTVLELAKQLTQDMDGDGKTDQWGLGWAGGTDILHSQTGVPLCELTPDGNVKQNLRNPKIEAAANFFRSLGPAGNNVMIKDGGEITQDYIAQQFGTGKVAMIATQYWRGGTPDLMENWKKGTVDFVPVPKWMGESNNYSYGQIGSMGVSSKAKNPQGAALFIQVYKYTFTSAYATKYMPGVDPTVDVTMRDVWGMNDEQLKRAYDIFHMDMTPVPNLYWIFWSWDDGFYNVLSKPWSQVVEELEPVAQKSIDDWVAKLGKVN